MFDFKTFDGLSDGEIRLVHKSADEPDFARGHAPRYGFSIIHIKDNRDIGTVYFSLDTSRRQYLVGHLSYGVDPAYKGHNFAAKACRLVRQVALAHGFTRLFVGSRASNIASRKTIEKLGARAITAEDVPDPTVLDELKAAQIDMFVWILEGTSAPTSGT